MGAPRFHAVRFGMLAALVAAGACSDEAPVSMPEASSCRGASCAGMAAAGGGGEAGSEPAADGGKGGRGGAGAGGGPQSGTAAGRGGEGGASAVGAPAAGTAAGSGGAAAGSGGSGGAAAGSGENPRAGAGASGSSGGAGDACHACEAYAPPSELARVRAGELDAMSGIAVGRKNPRLLFAHNDRARPIVYALDQQGELRARLALDTPATDIEDIAIGPCPEGTCIFLADIGDNAAQRAEYAILRFAEPELPDASSASMSMPAFERLRFSYEDGSHNAEGFMVDPGSGKLYVVTKVADGQPSRIYRIEDAAGGSATRRAVKVADLPVPKSSDMAVSAAAAQPCGRGFVLRTYNTMYEFRIAAGAAFESAFSVIPVALNAPAEQQSEAIHYVPDGRAIVSSGEGAGAPIFVTRCEP